MNGNLRRRKGVKVKNLMVRGGILRFGVGLSRDD